MVAPISFTDLPLLHSHKPADIYVILSGDGSTIVKDPGLNRPWSSTNRKLADHIAALITKQTGSPCHAVTLDTAIPSILRHPKNQPNYKGPK